MQLNKTKILVTGGAGFIGSHLCDKLIEFGAYVFCLDNFSTGSIKNVSHLMNKRNFKLIEGDIRDYSTCLKASENIDYVFHQAALGSVPRSLKDPILTNEVNIDGFLNIILASSKSKVKRFIFAASSSTYGDSSTLPKVEDEIGNPLSPYAVTKLVNEIYAKVFSDNYNINFIGLRYFNVFGPRQNPNGAYAAVIPNFISKFIKHESPTINGDGKYSRDFTYIKNVIEANIKCIFSSKKSLNNIYNIAYGERTTIEDLGITIRNQLANFDNSISNIKINYGPIRNGDIPHSLASIEKAKALLNYNPQYSVFEGLDESISWYYKNLKNEN